MDSEEQQTLVSLSDLPEAVLLHIFRLLDANDLAKVCVQVRQSLELCGQHWCVQRCYLALLLLSVCFSRTNACACWEASMSCGSSWQ